MSKDKKFTDNELIDILVNYEKKHGKSPSATIFYQSDFYPSADTYKKRFGSWNKALEKAGLKTITKHMPRCFYFDLSS